MKTPNKPRNNNDKKGGEDEDDRKPPAKEIVITDDDDDEEDTADDDTWEDDSPLPPRTTYARLPSSAHATPLKSSNKYLPDLTAVTPGSVVVAPPHNNNRDSLHKKPQNKSNNNDPTQTALRHVRTILYTWLGTSTLATGGLLYQLLPQQAFVTLLFLLISCLATVQMLYFQLQAWYQDSVVHGDGLGAALLPSWLHTTLTTTTLHQYLTNDENGVSNEYRYLALYFMPLSSQQLNSAIQQLSARHRQVLFQPGLGYTVLPSPMMRTLVGERRYTAWQQQRTTHTRTPITTTQRRLLLGGDDDSSSAESDLGLELCVDDLVGGNDAVARRLRLVDEPNTAIDDDDKEEEEEQQQQQPDRNDDEEEDYATLEYNIVMAAFWDSVNSMVWEPMMDTVWRFWRRSGARLGILGLGGSVAWYAGTGIVRRIPRLTNPQRNMWWSNTLFLGGTSIGLFVVMRRHQRLTESNDKNGDEDDDKPTDR